MPDAEVGRLMAKSTPSMFVPLDVNYMRDPRIRRAGPDAELLYLRALAYAKGGETDGFVHDFDLDANASGLRNCATRSVGRLTVPQKPTTASTLRTRSRSSGRAASAWGRWICERSTDRYSVRSTARSSARTTARYPKGKRGGNRARKEK